MSPKERLCSVVTFSLECTCAEGIIIIRLQSRSSPFPFLFCFDATRANLKFPLRCRTPLFFVDPCATGRGGPVKSGSGGTRGSNKRRRRRRRDVDDDGGRRASCAESSTGREHDPSAAKKKKGRVVGRGDRQDRLAYRECSSFTCISRGTFPFFLCFVRSFRVAASSNASRILFPLCQHCLSLLLSVNVCLFPLYPPPGGRTIILICVMSPCILRLCLIHHHATVVALFSLTKQQ